MFFSRLLQRFRFYSPPLPQVSSVTPRGIRNRNPGNLRKSTIDWLGEVPGFDYEFESFDTDEHGLRALAKNLLAYQDLHGLRTIAAIISRYAPNTENGTDAYIAAVSEDMRIPSQQLLNLHDVSTLVALVKAIVRHENGQQPYSEATIEAGVNMALA